jgi:hypothetical protein
VGDLIAVDNRCNGFGLIFGSGAAMEQPNAPYLWYSPPPRAAVR